MVAITCIVDSNCRWSRPVQGSCICSRKGGGRNPVVKNRLTGPDEHQVRRWASWYRWTTLAMLACAFLTITAAAEHTAARRRPGRSR